MKPKNSAATLHFMTADSRLGHCGVCGLPVERDQRFCTIAGVIPEDAAWPTIAHLLCVRKALTGIKPEKSSLFTMTPIYNVENGALLEMGIGGVLFHLTAESAFQQGLNMIVFSVAAQLDAWAYYVADSLSFSQVEIAEFIKALRKHRAQSPLEGKRVYCARDLRSFLLEEGLKSALGYFFERGSNALLLGDVEESFRIYFCLDKKVQ